MGSQVKSKCNCGFDKSILIGGGMMNFDKVCLFPCYCETCKDIVEVNLLDNLSVCPRCKKKGLVAYDMDSLIGEKGNKIVERWNVSNFLGRELILTNGRYKCPRCNKMNLRFEGGLILWD